MQSVLLGVSALIYSGFDFNLSLICMMFFFCIIPKLSILMKNNKLQTLFMSSSLLASRGGSWSKKDVKGLPLKGKGLCLFPLNFY